MFNGADLEAARTALGFSHGELAERIGAAPSQVWQWERRNGRPPVRYAARLALILNLPAEDLLAGPVVPPTLAELRLDAGVSIPGIFAATGVQPRLYRSLENGTAATAPKETVLLALAALLGVAPQEVRAAVEQSRAQRIGST